MWLPTTSFDNGTLTVAQLGLALSLADGSDADGSWTVGSATEFNGNSSITQQAITGRFAVPAGTRSASLVVAPPGGFSTDGKSYSDPLHLPIKLAAA